ncbi:MAG: thioredoxin family protein [Candidatus Portnoybacteria bacterium]|nr:thioredoxin family protein [Candidatus Portnoybacteria bacterium]
MTNNNSQKGFAMSFVIAIIALVVVIGGVFYFTSRQQSPAKEDAAVKPAEEDTVKKDDAMMEKKGGETMMKKDGETMTKDEGSMMEKKDDAMMKGETMTKYTGVVLAGKSAALLDFTKADYDAAVKSDKLVTLYFYANWCPICKAEFPIMQKTFNELTTDKVIGFRVNYNDDETDTDEKNLASQFGVAYQHTKVFVKNGQRILKSPEGWDDKRYDMEIAKALAQ